jgi:hypothetical protein
MFRQPEALIAETLGMAGQVAGVSQGAGDAGLFGDGGEIEDRERNHS